MYTLKLNSQIYRVRNKNQDILGIFKILDIKPGIDDIGNIINHYLVEPPYGDPYWLTENYLMFEELNEEELQALYESD